MNYKLIRFSIAVGFVALLLGCATTNGQGEKSYTDSNNSSWLYKGNFRNGLRSGYGELSNRFGETYKGQWKGDALVEGEYISPNQIRFKGTFLNGLFKHGEATWPNGEVFIGSWKPHKLNRTESKISKGYFLIDGVKYETLDQGEWQYFSYDMESYFKGNVHEKLKITTPNRIIKGNFKGELFSRNLEISFALGNTVTFTKPHPIKINGKQYTLPKGTVFNGKISSDFKLLSGQIENFKNDKGHMFTIAGNFQDENKKLIVKTSSVSAEEEDEYVKNVHMKAIEKRIAQAPCKSFPNWVYKGECKNGLAHGKGVAYSAITNYRYERFEGTFENGGFKHGVLKLKLIRIPSGIARSYPEFTSKYYLVKKESASHAEGSFTRLRPELERENYVQHGLNKLYTYGELTSELQYINGVAQGTGKCYWEDDPVYIDCVYKDGNRVDELYVKREKRKELERRERAHIAREQEKMKKLQAEREAAEAKIERLEWIQRQKEKEQIAKEKRERQRQRQLEEDDSGSWAQSLKKAYVNSSQTMQKSMQENALQREQMAYNIVRDRQAYQQQQAHQEAEKAEQAKKEAERKLRIAERERQDQAKLFEQQRARDKAEYDRKIAAQRTRLKVAQAKQVESEKAIQATNKTKEALAYCAKNEAGLWQCDGPKQLTLHAEKTVEKQLGYVGCEHYRKSIAFNKGKLFFCDYKLRPGDTSKMSWNRDIRGWMNIPSNY